MSHKYPHLAIVAILKNRRMTDCTSCTWPRCLVIHQQNVTWFGSHISTTQLFRTATPILPEAPRCSRTGWMQNDVLLRNSESTSGAPQRSWSSGTEYKNILKSMKSCSECYKITPLSWQNFGAAGTTTLVSKTIPVHLEIPVHQELDSLGVINI